MEIIIYIACSYLIGSIPFGYLAGKMKGVDLREHGSRNIGATNAVRVLGRPVGLTVFFLDFLKGFLPVFIWRRYAFEFLSATDIHPDGWWFYGGMVLSGLAVVIGHTYTCFLGFKGGKGVASTAGILFALSWVIGTASLGGWILALFVTRYVSVASTIAAFLMTVMSMYVFGFFKAGGFSWRPEVLVVLLMVFISALVVYKHMGNFARIKNGTEPKAFTKK